MPRLHRGTLLGRIPHISFYGYESVNVLLHTKHTDLGYYCFQIMAQESFVPFSEAFVYDRKIAALGIDDQVKSGYAHTALLAKALQSRYITPRYGKLRASNTVHYAGKSRQYRLEHPRNFTLLPFQEESVILVDDIMTTGTTLIEAINTIERAGKEVLMCLTLADVEGDKEFK